MLLRRSACLSYLLHPALPLSQSPPFSMCSSSRNMESSTLYLWAQLCPFSLPSSSIPCVAALSFACPAEKPRVNSQSFQHGPNPKKGCPGLLWLLYTCRGLMSRYQRSPKKYHEGSVLAFLVVRICPLMQGNLVVVFQLVGSSCIQESPPKFLLLYL